ncbi:Mu transposase domain-containing protein [Streptomyces mirabilis]|uniref:Mu transposase domain-containing protein n=1 Tax=Streptomyces mirabilis TaxID=68239 RepID=UPI003BEED001
MEDCVTPQGLVAFRGNHYSVPPGLPGAQVTVTMRLGEDSLRIATAGRAVIAQHHRAPDGAG